MENVKTSIVGIFTVFDDGVLYLKRSPNEKPYENMWCIPSGTVEEGESPYATARREFQEETGLNPEGIAIEYVDNFNFPIGKNVANIMLFFSYVKGSIDEVKISNEHVDKKLYTLEELEHIAKMGMMRGEAKDKESNDALTPIDHYILNNYLSAIQSKVNVHRESMEKLRQR
ncbi:MAG: NUDIX hydrolase [Candidatus Micrarchaeia archaeon]